MTAKGDGKFVRKPVKAELTLNELKSVVGGGALILSPQDRHKYLHHHGRGRSPV
jgi:hypothetical protein